MNAIRLYGRYVGVSLRSQMQYPAWFLLTSAGAFAATGVDFLATWALFARFRQVAGWHLGEVALFYSVIGVSFALADGLTRGFDIFGDQFVRTGDFDRLLVRPRSTVLQLLGYELRATRIGRLAQALVVGIIAIRLTGITWHVTAWATLSASSATTERTSATRLAKPQITQPQQLGRGTPSIPKRLATIQRTSAATTPARPAAPAPSTTWSTTSITTPAGGPPSRSRAARGRA